MTIFVSSSLPGSLLEAGGVLSWLRRMFTNVDPEIEDQLRADLSQIGSEEDRSKLLQEIDFFLKEAQKSKSDGVVGDFLSSIPMAAGLGIVGRHVGMQSGMTAPLPPPGKVTRLTNWLMRRDPQTTHAKGVAKQYGKYAFVGAAAIATVLKLVNRYDGTLDDYIGALESLRAEVEAKEIPTLREAYLLLPLSESLGTVVRNLATGDVEEEIDELKKEAQDIHTPEQQRIVATRITRLMEKLVALRHNPGVIQRMVHDSVSWFSRQTGHEDSSKELTVRSSEALRNLAGIRDRVLAKKWSNDEDTQKLEALKTRTTEILRNAEKHDAGE